MSRALDPASISTKKKEIFYQINETKKSTELNRAKMLGNFGTMNLTFER